MLPDTLPFRSFRLLILDMLPSRILAWLGEERKFAIGLEALMLALLGFDRRAGTREYPPFILALLGFERSCGRAVCLSFGGGAGGSSVDRGSATGRALELLTLV